MERPSVARRVLLTMALALAIADEMLLAEDTESRRPMSIQTAALLAAARPKFDASAKPRKETLPSVLERAGAPSTDADVILLAPFVVKDRYVPPLALVDPNAVTQKLERKYLGSADGLDRAILNRFTIAEYWRKIPLLRQIGLAGVTSLTNEQRANLFDGMDERVRRNRDLMDATSVTIGTVGETQDRELRQKIQEAVADPRYR